MSDDLIERLELCARAHPHPGNPENGKLLSEAAARIRELESEIQYRRDHTGDLIQDRDECKVSMVHYALDLKAAKRRIRELEARLATAEADALERAARAGAREALKIAYKRLAKLRPTEGGPPVDMESFHDAIGGACQVTHTMRAAAEINKIAQGAIRSLKPKADE